MATQNCMTSLADFLKTDLQVSLTFAKLALESSDPDKIKRDTQNAVRGYNAIVHFLGRASFSDEDTAFIERRLKELQEALTKLEVVCALR